MHSDSENTFGPGFELELPRVTLDADLSSTSYHQQLPSDAPLGAGPDPVAFYLPQGRGPGRSVSRIPALADQDVTGGASLR
jgi:hypothetical protein